MRRTRSVLLAYRAVAVGRHETLRAREASQWPCETKKARADVVLPNEDSDTDSQEHRSALQYPDESLEMRMTFERDIQLTIALPAAEKTSGPQRLARRASHGELSRGRSRRTPSPVVIRRLVPITVFV